MLNRGDLDIERYRAKIGCYIQIPNIGRGKLKYVGPVESKQGYFAGIDLLANIGKNIGSFNGRKYFETEYPLSGLFIQLQKVGYLIERATEEATTTTGRRENNTTLISPRISRRSTLGGGSGSVSSIGKSVVLTSDTRMSLGNYDDSHRSFLKQKSPTPVGRNLRTTSAATVRLESNTSGNNNNSSSGNTMADERDDRMYGMAKSASTVGLSQGQQGSLMPPVNVNTISDIRNSNNNGGNSNNNPDNIDDEMSIDMTPSSALRSQETAPVPVQTTSRNLNYFEVSPQIVKEYELKIERQQRVILEYEKLLNEQRVVLEEIQPVIDACEKKSQRLERERDQLKEQLSKQKQYFEKEHEQLMNVINSLREEISEKERQAAEEKDKEQQQQQESEKEEYKERDILNSQVVLDLKTKLEELEKYKMDMEYAKTKWDKERDQLKMHTESLSKEYQSLNKELMAALSKQQEAERNAKEVESLRKQLQNAKDKIKELNEFKSREDTTQTQGNSLPLYEPAKKVDAAAGRKQWCVLCEKFGHIQIDCPFQHEGQPDELVLDSSREGDAPVDAVEPLASNEEEEEMYY